MNLRENVRAILHYESFDHMPVVHFGYLSLIHISEPTRRS